MASSTQRVQTAVLHAPKDLRVQERDLPPPGPGEVQVAVTHTGLCGSDLHYYKDYANGDIIVREPLTLGHEASGIVTSLGADVSTLSVGTRVALEVGVPCHTCDFCASGRYNLCSSMRFRSSAKSFPHFQGTLQTRINHPARWCYALPDGISSDQGALLEPLAVALHALRRAGIDESPSSSDNSDALVLGAGAVGLLVAICLTARGRRVVIADISAARVEFAEQNGFAKHGVVLPLKRGSTVEEKMAIAQENRALLCAALGQMRGVETEQLFGTAFECTGVESCVQTGIYSTVAGGKLALVGMGQPVQTLHLAAAMLREVDLVGVFRYADCYPEGIAMLQDGKLCGIEKLVTHRFRAFAGVEDAFRMAGRTEDEDGRLVIKVMIDLGAEGSASA